MKIELGSIGSRQFGGLGHPLKDAVHVAVVALRAHEALEPGERVATDGYGTTASVNPRREAVGVVDPFIQRTVMPGETVTVMLLPNTITDLSHTWSHPAFPDPEPSDDDDDDPSCSGC